MKKAALALVLSLLFLIVGMVGAQSVSYYGRDSGVNPAAFTLIMYSPRSETAYSDTMLLQFNITWTTFPRIFGPEQSLDGVYTYRIDDNPPVSIAPNQSASDRVYVTPLNNFTINPSFSYLVNIADLPDGDHKIVITASLYINGNHLYFSESASPIGFLVQNPTPTPTPEESFPNVLIVVASVALAGVGAGLLLYFRRHKH
ncbi:MAG: hypothetical protein NWF09_03430 [Candidatus Bathyarchaeota archaeon]|nr:hypothetical protein [Candidatus Bathyarchaeota archaeon]